MSTGIFASYDTQDLNRIAAKGILEKLRTIRQKINVNLTARRIIWELIQNAKDNVLICQNQNTSLKIAIELTNNSFTFSHNNGFLTNENIRGLIRRYSSSDKDRDYNSLKDPPLTTGRFGTGFMTTHLLSEKVTVKGIYKDENCEFRQFTLPINRTGTNEKDIINSIESSFSEVEYSIINSPKINKDPYEFETKFIYELDDEGYKYSLIAIDDFNLCIGPTLINLVSVDEVKVKIGETTTIYKLKEKENYKKAELNFSITELQKNENTLENNKFLVIDNDKIRLIFLIDKVEDRYLIKIFDSKVPRLFLDFPLVGTEKINIPFIINSRFFEPTEERDGVSLTGSDDRDTKVNSSILIEANNLFKLFLDLVCSDDKWSNLFNLARFNLPEEDRWINLEWYKSSILKPIRDKLIKSKIVETATGSRKSIKDINDRDQIYFPYDTKEENRMILWELSKLIFPDYIPIREDVNAWYEIIWEDCYKLNVEKLAEKISKFDSIDELKTELKLSEEEVFGWLNRFYELIFNDKSFVNKKKFNDYKIFPNQNGKFSNLSDLSIDDDIEEELKNVLKILDVDIRNKLLHKKVVFDQEDLLKEIKINIKDQEWVVDYINKSLEKIKSNEVIDYLISLFSNDPDFPPERELIYNFNRIIFKNRIPEKKSIKKWSKSIWKNADKLRISDLVIEISNRKNIDGLVKLLGEDSEKTLLCWLQKFIDFLREYNFEEMLNTLESPIIPNQNNVFKAKDKLFVQDTNLSE
ncbi:MAG: hypothetical protein NZM09_02625, partial [Ignavibacterium sp.]|nr:hypothetical protein [Ignavibacterium sp.]MDW8374570.1 hypothetical protein [Ignavibacteriales bacterium]